MMKKLYPIALFTIIPFIILVLSLLFLKDIANFFMSWFDPVYAYLFNGLNLAQGSIDLGHTDHPGTPLQMLCAIIIRITFLFQTNGSLVENVLGNPELYLKNISIVLITLNAVMLFFLGYFTHKKTLDIKTAFALQFTPLVSMVAMYFMPIVACETFLVFCGTGMVLLAYLYTYTNNALKPKTFLIWFIIFSALSIATKISSFPVIIIPLFILKGIRNKLWYLSLTILLFFIFISPILPIYSHHFDFLKNIVSHTGRFGLGNKGVIDSNIFINNLISLFTTEFPFTITFFGLLITCLLTLIKKKWFSGIDNKQKNLLWGIFLVFMVQIIIVAKHFSFHYMIPAYVYAVLGLIVIMNFYQPFLKKYILIAKPIVWWIIGFIFLTGFTLRLINRYHFYPNIYNPVKNTEVFLNGYEKTPKIIISSGYACALKESALYFGKVYSGEINKLKYARILKNKYPLTYFYSKDLGLYDWQKNILKNELFSKYDKLIVYDKGLDSIAISENLKALLSINTDEKLLNLSKIYENKKTKEVVYLLIADTVKIRKLSSLKIDLYSDLEILDSSKTSFADSSGKFFFEKGNLQSSEKPHSGKYSIKLTKEAPYGLDLKLKLTKNTFFRITVWRNSPDKNGVVVGCTNDPSFYKNSSNIIEVGDNGWELVELTFDASMDIPDHEIHLYLWNNGNEPIYFDDIHVEGYY